MPYHGQVFLGRDGLRLARIIELASSNPFKDSRALEFYSSGDLVLSYKVGDLVSKQFAAKQRKRGSYHWLDYQRRPRAYFVQGRDLLEVFTWDGRRYSFDMETG